MSALRPGEWDNLLVSFPGATRVESPDGSVLVALPATTLPDGWSLTATPVWFVTPVGYPAAQPDCFWAASELRLSSGAMPANSGVQPVPATAQLAVWFSWHLASWRPSIDNLTTYARFVLRRLADAR